MRQLLLGLALAAQLVPLRAQDAGLPPITVRPSGIEDPSAESRERQERLSRRLERSDYAFRSICTHCAARRDQAGGDAPFYPYQVLGRGPVRDAPAE